MSVQSSYSANITKGFAGLIADINPKVTLTGIVEEANGIDFGLGVIQGTADDQIKLPSSSGDTLNGVTVHSHSFELDENNVAIMKDEDVGTVMEDGFIYVSPEDAVIPGDVAFFRYSASFQVSTLTFDQALTSGSVDLDVDGVAMPPVEFTASMA